MTASSDRLMNGSKDPYALPIVLLSPKGTLIPKDRDFSTGGSTIGIYSLNSPSCQLLKLLFFIGLALAHSKIWSNSQSPLDSESTLLKCHPPKILLFSRKAPLASHARTVYLTSPDNKERVKFHDQVDSPENRWL